MDGSKEPPTKTHKVPTAPASAVMAGRNETDGQSSALKAAKEATQIVAQALDFDTQTKQPPPAPRKPPPEKKDPDNDDPDSLFKNMDVEAKLLAMFSAMPMAQKIKAVGISSGKTQQNEVEIDHKKPDTGSFAKKEDDVPDFEEFETQLRPMEPMKLNDELELPEPLPIQGMQGLQTTQLKTTKERRFGKQPTDAIIYSSSPAKAVKKPVKEVKGSWADIIDHDEIVDKLRKHPYLQGKDAELLTALIMSEEYNEMKRLVKMHGDGTEDDHTIMVMLMKRSSRTGDVSIMFCCAVCGKG